jgi:hypothetical protein
MKKNLSLYKELFSDESNFELEEPTNNLDSTQDYNEIIAFENIFSCVVPDSDEKNNEDGEELKRYYILKLNKNVEITQEEKKHLLFDVTHLKQKRGRNIISKRNRKMHDSSFTDNIITKIQIHFLKFMINFLNDCIHSEYKNRKKVFKHFNHPNKCKATLEYVNKLKRSTINDILNEFDISAKYKSCDNDINILKNKKNKHNLFTTEVKSISRTFKFR